jgi:hypothetical protein
VKDMRERWLPDPQAVALARKALDADPTAASAIVPMIQPGKEYGIWMPGQEVRTVHGVVILARQMDAGQLPDYGEACEMCRAVARSVLGSKPGTVAHAVVEREGSVAVFEDDKDN